MARQKRFQQGVAVLTVLIIAASMIIPVSARDALKQSISLNFTSMVLDLPNTGNRTFSNVQVAKGDVTGAGANTVEISFDVTLTGRDGTSNTMSIIAILIGLVQDRGQSSYLNYRLSDVIISSYSFGSQTPSEDQLDRLANAAGRSAANAFTRSVRSWVRGLNLDQPFRMEQTSEGIIITPL